MHDMLRVILVSYAPRVWFELKANNLGRLVKYYKRLAVAKANQPRLLPGLATTVH